MLNIDTCSLVLSSILMSVTLTPAMTRRMRTSRTTMRTGRLSLIPPPWSPEKRMLHNWSQRKII